MVSLVETSKSHHGCKKEQSGLTARMATAGNSQNRSAAFQFRPGFTSGIDLQVSGGADHLLRASFLKRGSLLTAYGAHVTVLRCKCFYLGLTKTRSAEKQCCYTGA